MKSKQPLREGLFTFGIILFIYVMNIATQNWFNTKSLIPMLFVLGTFIVSLKTEGFFWGILASLISVLAVNYAFTYPYYAIDLISPECVASAIVMLSVSIATSMLTTRIKLQEKARSEAERERMRANLLRAVSHDLRTPLTTIYGSCSAILENYETLTKEQKLKLLDEMQQDSEWLIRMVENLLSVTRIDDGNVKLTKMPTVLEELIDTVLVKFRKHYPNQPIEVSLPDDFISIPMDAMLIEQVLINLLENAVDHAKGMTTLRLTVTVSDCLATFCVSDDGCGIPAAQIDKLFTGLMDHTHDRPDSRRSNMGIGLSVCSTIIRAHDGEIHAENNEDRGASFYFSLNLEEE